MTMYSNPVSLFISQEQAAGIPIVGFSSNTWSGDPSVLQFASTVTPQQITQCQADAAAFNWTPQPLPDYSDFLVAALTTPGITIQDAIVCIVLAQQLTNTQRATLWTNILQSYASHPTNISTLAAQYNLPV